MDAVTEEKLIPIKKSKKGIEWKLESKTHEKFIKQFLKLSMNIVKHKLNALPDFILKKEISNSEIKMHLKSPFENQIVLYQHENSICTYFIGIITQEHFCIVYEPDLTVFDVEVQFDKFHFIAEMQESKKFDLQYKKGQPPVRPKLKNLSEAQKWCFMLWLYQIGIASPFKPSL